MIPGYSAGFVMFTACIPSAWTDDDAMFGMNTLFSETSLPVTGSKKLVSEANWRKSKEDQVQ